MTLELYIYIYTQSINVFIIYAVSFLKSFLACTVNSIFGFELYDVKDEK